MAAVGEVLGQDRFRVNAWRRASRVIGDLPRQVDQIGADLKALTGIEGVGKGTAERIVEFLETGRVKDHDELVAKVPAGLLELLDVSGLGPKSVALLWKEAGVESVDDLRAKLGTGELTELPGFGPKKLENIGKSIAFAEKQVGRVRIGVAMPLAEGLVERLLSMKPVKKAAYAGSLRRGKETIGDIDLLVAVDPKSSGGAEAVADAFVGFASVEDVLLKGSTKTSVRTDAGIQIDLRVVEPAAYGAALMYFTGSKEHNVALRERAIKRGMRLNEYALKKGEKIVASRTEEEIYKALGLGWIEPELREHHGEVALAERGELPKLITLGDVKAELHAHTTASDGKWSIHELAAAAAERGFHTVAVTDHSQSQPIANGLSPKRLEKHIKDVHAVAERLRDTITVLAGSEVDILADGSLDYPDSLLAELDVVVASPHNALSQDPGKATARLLKAIENPYVTMIGHPTGRLIGRREGLSPDMGALIAAAAERGIALEINANSWRLDLRDVHARAAIEAGVKLAINTDAHGPADLGQLRYGVLTARRAGATKKAVVNCMSRAALAKWLRSTRA